MTAAVADRLVEFVTALREKGINAGPSETIDAAQIIDVLGLTERERLREGLAAAFVRRGGQRDVFDMTFDVYFPLGVGATQDSRGVENPHDLEALRAALTEALARADRDRMRQLAEQAVDGFGEVGEAGSQLQGWSANQTLDTVFPQRLIAAATEQRMSLAGTPGGVADSLARQEVRAEVAEFGRMVASAARRRTAEVRGRRQIARHAVRPGTGEVEFLSADRAALEQMKNAVQPLARKLASRLAVKRRRRRRGQIDIRRTLRRSMGTGGVPISPVYARPRPRKPDLVLLCDVSGSVAGFSQFTMLLVRALAEQFSRVRVFAFVNAVAEVTEIIAEGHTDLTEQIAERARITSWHTSSDYGAAFDEFVVEHLEAVGPRSSVLVLGDGRNNNLPSGIEALMEIVDRAHRAFWLNPEHESRWGLGDSIAPEYAEVIEMHEVRTMTQLSQFVTRLLPV